MEEYNRHLTKFKEIEDKLQILILKFPANRREEIIFDKWSLKNVVSHLSHWMDHDIFCLNSFLNNIEPFWEPNVEEFNSKGVETRKDKKWEEVFSEFVELKSKLLNLYSKIPSNLVNKKIWEDHNETPLSFLNEDVIHWQNEHIKQLEEFLNP